ncbi:MAG: hypothetical protein J1F23_03960 [Oscillospiraceae bacterium]|nr:hypothetical protein [Oscillospiraceae bacterium]
MFSNIAFVKRIKEWLSVQIAKNPAKIVLAAILLFNVFFFFIAAVVISNMALSGTEQMSFLEAAFCTVTMILDAGCIQFVVADIGEAKVALVVVCLVIIFIGMISFTGAVIGYLTNYISNFIENSNAGARKLHMSDHVVILNWNTRASEIVNDLLYCNEKQNVVVLVNRRKNEVEKEIAERLSDTVARENDKLQKRCKKLPLIKRLLTVRKERLRNRITVIVREGDVFSSKQLNDISLKQAKTVIILGSDFNNTVCKFETRERMEEHERGNSQTVKTLMQVADITAAADSNDNQRIIVEITDDWTYGLVDKIIQRKVRSDEEKGKCNIIPVRVNQILGQILSQFSLMPELNLVYKELFSNKGAAFFTEQHEVMADKDFIPEYMRDHKHAIPLTYMTYGDKAYHYFSAESENDIHTVSRISKSDYAVKLNENYWIENKNVIILGHNSKCRDIMQGFAAFCNEWQYKNGDDEVLRIVVIDDQKNLEKMDFYKEYPFVVDTVPASIYDREKICDTIKQFVEANNEDTSILILSDDMALNEDIDANALANLIYVQDIIKEKEDNESEFDPESIDVIVEIIDPKHHDIVNSYSVNNVVISNRYISKMITQIGEKDALFDFYTDILTYDEDDSDGYNSKEIYTKKVNRLFDEIPKKCTAEEFIRAVYKESIDVSLKTGVYNPTVALGYVKPGGRMFLFSGDQSQITVELDEKDKLIVFSNH